VQYGGAIPTFDAVDAVVSQGSGAPTAAAVKSVLTANAAINSAVANGTAFGIAEVGGGHASTGTDSETSTSTFYLAVNTGALAKPADLKIGFYGGQATGAGGGAGVTNVTVSVTENGTNLLAPVVFTNAADAVSYFNDHALDLGAIAKGTVLDLAVNLSVTTNAAGAGFYGDFIMGNAPGAFAASYPNADPRVSLVHLESMAHLGHVLMPGLL
jgi:hypothetical protein